MADKDFKLGNVYFYISGGCNLKCRHCWIAPDSADRDMDLAAIKEVINQAADMGVRQAKLTGGEPFLREDIFEVLQYLKDKDFKIIIETNGTLIQEQEAQKLKDLGVSFISVSIDSPDAEFHDNFRQLKGAFDMAIRGLKALKKAGFSPQIIASIYRENVDSIDKLALLVQDLGAGSLKLNPINKIGRGQDFAEQKELLGVKELIELERYIQSSLQPKVKIAILLDIPLAFKTISYIRSNRSSCGLLGIIGILADGTISLCGIGEQIEDLNMGNIRKDKLAEVWNNNRILNFIRENIPHKLEGICGRCMLKNICLGKCRADAYHQTKTLTAPFYFCQQAYEAGLFPQTRVLPDKHRTNFAGESSLVALGNPHCI